MDFTSLYMSDIFTRVNKQLRKRLYVVFAETEFLQHLFTTIRNQFQKYIDTNLLQLQYDDDIIYSFLVALKYDKSKKEQIRKELKVVIKVRPLFAPIKIAPALKISNQVVQKMNAIGYQHLHLKPSEQYGSDSRPSTSNKDFWSGDNTPLTKKLEECQRAINNDSPPMLGFHVDNMKIIKGVAVHVDVLIYMNESYCKEVSKYLGLIYIEELLEKVEGKPFELFMFHLANKDVKLYRLIQTYINTKLIRGCNNICLVNNFVLWNNINANVRAYIVSDPDDKNIAIAESSHFQIVLGKEPSFLDYIEAISIIIDETLSCKCHVIAKYECGQNLYSKVKLSLASIVPLHVLRYFSQCAILDGKHEL